MNKLFTKIAGVFLGLAMAVGVGAAVTNSSEAVPVSAATGTVDLAEGIYSGSGTSGKIIWSTEHFTITQERGNSSTNVNESYVSAPRWYTSHVITFAFVGGKTVNSIVVTATSNSYAKVLHGSTWKNSTATLSGANVTITPTVGFSSFSVTIGAQARISKISYDFTASGLSFSYDGNGSTSGTLPSMTTYYDTATTITVSDNTGNLAKTGYIWSGWNTKKDGTGLSYNAGDTFSLTSDTVLYAKWVADIVESLSIAGSMSKTKYFAGALWDSSGFVVTASYKSNTTADITSKVTWTYFVDGVEKPSATIGDTSVVAIATFDGKTVSSSPQAIEVLAGAEYDLTKITDFSKWTSSYGSHNLTEKGFNPIVDVPASIEFLITNKQSSGVGSTYPCIGDKTNTEKVCLTFSLNDISKKISAVDITFVTRYTDKYPSLYLHKGNGIDSSPISTLNMSGNVGDELSLSCDNLNDVTFTIGYNAHQTSKNGAVGIKSISIGLEDQTSFGVLDHIKITSLPTGSYHVGEKYDATGLSVMAYDGADETSSNFKDVTNSPDLSVLIDDGYTFVETDVPGIDIDVEYKDSGKTCSTSFYVSVYLIAKYKLVTSEQADWSGNYLIVGTNSKNELCAMDGSLSNLDVEHGYKVVTSSADGIVETGQELEWTISSYDSGYSICGKSGKYIGSATTQSNGLLSGNAAFKNSLSYGTDASKILGTNGYGLSFNPEGDRFRYYKSGTIQLYKLIETSNADSFAQQFLNAFVCDATGLEKPAFASKDENTVWTWELLSNEYDAMTTVDKEQFRLAVASTTGSNISQAVAKYDYIVGKYYKTGIDTSFNDFMLRNPMPIGSSGVLTNRLDANCNNSISIIVVVSLISATLVGSFFFIRKRKEQN